MSDLRERLLEHALYEALGGDGANAPDLAPAIREAWEQRVRDGAERPAPARPRTEAGEGHQSRPWWLPIAAAAIAAAGAGAWLLAERADPSATDGPLDARTARAEPRDVAPQEAGSQPADSIPTADMLERADIIKEALASLAEPELPPEMRLELITTFYREGPLAELRKTPELWPAVAPVVGKLLTPQELPRYARAFLIDALGVDPSADALGLIRAAWLVDPEAFSSDVVVVMAERGAFEFEREAQAWLESPSASPFEDAFALALYGALYGEPGGALRSDGPGAALLEKELVQESKEPERPILAAVALARMGRDVAWLDYWETSSAQLRDQLDDADLDADQLLAVTRAIDAWTYAWALHDRNALPDYEPTSEWDGFPRAGDFRHWLDLYYAAQSARTRTRQSLAEDLAALAGR